MSSPDRERLTETLRTLAEWRVCRDCGKGMDEVVTHIGKSQPLGMDVPQHAFIPILDARFASLRGEHQWDADECCVHCPAFGANEYHKPTQCLRTDLGSIVRAAVACGLKVEVMPVHGVKGFEFQCRLLRDWNSPYEARWNGVGPTPEDAAASALAAWAQEARA
jgi:hypothetical protein